jgi:hypothetical protein
MVRQYQPCWNEIPYTLPFDVILGKPWLHEARAIHYYATNTLVISTDTNTAAINNTDDTTKQESPQVTVEPPTPTVNITSLDDLIHAELHRIETLQRTNGHFTETKWA